MAIFLEEFGSSWCIVAERHIFDFRYSNLNNGEKMLRNVTAIKVTIVSIFSFFVIIRLKITVEICNFHKILI